MVLASSHSNHGHEIQEGFAGVKNGKTAQHTLKETIIHEEWAYNRGNGHSRAGKQSHPTGPS